MKLKDCFLSIFLFTAINAAAIDPEDELSLIPEASVASSSRICPDYQLKCPNCPLGQGCVYPDSGGCSGAGIPICQAIDCHGILCLTKRLPCPDDCPFNCRYNGPPCCPFLGQPVCEPICQTFVACKVTPCPDECPGDCRYPNADYCCPKSGEAVCNIDSLEKRAFEYKNDGPPEDLEWFNEYNPIGPPEDLERVNGYNLNGDLEYQSLDYGYLAYQQPHHKDHYHYDHAHYHGQHEHGNGNKGGCPICTKTVTDVSVQLVFATTTREPGMPIECGNHIEPCPYECPYNCIYPMNEHCPFTQKPWCPSILDQTEEDCDTIYNTEGYPYPYFPSYDPYHEIFTSILNRSGVTSTPSFITESPTEIPSVLCPLIFILCPAECPDSCLRHDIPCPFAQKGFCPGSEPPTLPSNSILEQEVHTPAESVLSDGAILCPMYMLACPYCPSDYSCTRETTGYCPNTNVPYCFSTATVAEPTITSAAATIFEFYPEPYPPQLTQWRGWEGFEDDLVYHAMSLSSGDQERKNSASKSVDYTPEQLKHYMEEQENQDVCQKAGFIRIDSKHVFDQVQAEPYGCKGCPRLEWDEQCDNLCVFRTEKNCCIQSTCVPNE